MVVLWARPSGLAEQLHSPTAAFCVSHCRCLNGSKGSLRVASSSAPGTAPSPKAWRPPQASKHEAQAVTANGGAGRAASWQVGLGDPQKKPPPWGACCRARSNGAAPCTTPRFHPTPAQALGDALCLKQVHPILLFQLLPPTAPTPSRGALPANKPLSISKEGPLCSLLSTGPVPLL